MLDHPPLIIKGYNVGVLGDPHLGRRFINHTPMHRRGEREASINTHFTQHFAELKDQDLAVHVCMGDIFDRPIVTPEMIALVADAYKTGIETNPDTHFVLLAGNHDISRDLTMVNSFDILARILQPMGVTVVKDFAEELYHQDLVLGFCPWVPDRSSAQVAENLGECDAIFGHWDVVNPSTDINLVPKTLKTEIIVTGHDHRRRQEGKIVVVGSMEPYAHGEGDMYQTLTLAELETVSVEDRRNLCLRLVLAEGELVPENLDALQIQVVKAGATEAEGSMSVGFEGLDMQNLFMTVFSDLGVNEGLRNELFEKYRNRG